MAEKTKSRAKKSPRSKAPQASVGARVTFWGARGTLPTPGKSTLKYGGNTSCVEVRSGTEKNALSLIIDAGSGLANFGDAALARGDREFHVFLSHVHYDHIIGLTRFKPIFRRDCKVTFYGMGNCDKTLYEILQRFFSHPYFPVEFEALGANPNVVFHTIHEDNPMELGPFLVRFQRLNHPQGATGFRVEDTRNNTAVVYLTDHEHGTSLDQKIVEFSKYASLMLYDSTFQSDNYPRFKGWGHSTGIDGARLALAAQVYSYGLFHHDPEMSDEALEKKALPEAKKVFPRSFLCAEGKTIALAKLVPGPSRRS